ncbi:Epoxyqueuosine reductase [bioreactor metagenome]|uniref:Epoxyqueuosine reductase n=1 Tax=bioreactor metagenome TaxID=1076179 RepID=A0A644XFB0_9ZZZZ
MRLADEIEEMLKGNGVYDVGFSVLPDAPESLPYAVSIIVALSDAVVDEIGEAPTYTYYHHYRTVNAYIDRMLLQTGMLLQKEGFMYIPIAASQSINTGDGRTHEGRYSHKKAAVSAGLGTIGKSTLFLHYRLGPRVRLGTLFTDCPLAESAKTAASVCGSCELCVRACPAHAIKGTQWQEGLERGAMFDADACNNYMRQHFMKIGRGAVCGLCMKACKYSGY